jgi:hypothetical protein
MTFALIVQDTTATAIAIFVSNLYDGAASAPQTVDIQVSPRPDFQFCVCPIYTISPDAAATLTSLNQSADYYMRARRRYSDGSVDRDWTATVGARTKDGMPQAVAPQKIMIEPTLMVLPSPILNFADTLNVTVPGYPMQNLARDSPVAWRGIHPTTFICAFNVPTPIDTIAVLNTNLGESATMQIRAGNTVVQATGASPLFQTETMPFRASANLPGRNGYHGLYRLGAQRTYPWWSITIVAAPIAGMIHVEHLIAGVAMVSKNHSNDKNETAAPLTTVSRSRAGVADRVFGRPMRKVDFDLSFVSEAQYETIYGRLWQQQNNPVLVVPNAKEGGFLHDRILYGDLAQARIVNPSSPRFSMSLSINSII